MINLCFHFSMKFHFAPCRVNNIISFRFITKVIPIRSTVTFDFTLLVHFLSFFFSINFRFRIVRPSENEKLDQKQDEAKHRMSLFVLIFLLSAFPFSCLFSSLGFQFVFRPFSILYFVAHDFRHFNNLELSM